LSCACCVDRNRDSTRKKLALQRGEDLSSLDPAPNDTPKDPKDSGPSQSAVAAPSQTSPRHNSHAHHPVAPANRHYVSEPNHAPMSWGYYQPAPNAGTFLNPEFNRPFVLQSAYEDADFFSGGGARDTRRERVTEQVLEASSKFELSMQKLQAQMDQSFALPKDAVLLDS
ncbi:hypothetical protein EGW08_000056, partial [Elysia chlorotica]